MQSFSSPLSALIVTPEPTHATSSHNISYDARLRANNYAIYPGVLNDTYIYEQSNCSEYDALSTATFSPATSTDSTLTLRSPATPERFLEERARRPATPAAPSSYTVHGSMVPQAPAMNRTTSNHHVHQPLADTLSDRRSRVTSMQAHLTAPIRRPIPSASLNELTIVSSTGYNGEIPSHIPEYAASTISELEVDQRDKIAKINAEYNAVSSSTSSSYYSNDNAAVAIESIARRMSTSPPNQPLQNTFTSQPLHPNLHFPNKSDDFNPAFNPNPTLSIFSTKDGSPPLVERVPSRVESPPTNTQSGQFFQAQAQESWNRDGFYQSDHTRVSPHCPPPPPTNHLFDNGSTLRSTQTMYATSQESTSLNEYRPLPVPPSEAPRQRTTVERRPSVVGPRPDGNVGASDMRNRNQTTREYSYDQRRDVSNSPPRSLALPPSFRELPSRAAVATDMRKDTRTPAPRESNEYRSKPSTGPESYVADPQQPPVEPRSQGLHLTDTHLQPAAFIGPTERIRTRSTSFSNSARHNLPPVSNLGQHLSSPQKQYQTSNVATSDPRRVSEQDKHVRTSPPSKMQDSSVYHSDYMELERRNDVRGQAIYNSQPVTPTFNRDTHHQNFPIEQPSSKSNDRAPSYSTINSRNATQEAPVSRLRPSYFEVPAAPNSVPPRGATSYDKPSMPVKAGTSSSSNSPNHEYVVPPEQPTHRRYSDGDQNPPLRSSVESSGRSSAPPIRSVRWTENLICPSPVLATQRRKGWFNRRG
jgi:hypothetical protein